MMTGKENDFKTVYWTESISSANSLSTRNLIMQNLMEKYDQEEEQQIRSMIFKIHITTNVSH